MISTILFTICVSAAVLEASQVEHGMIKERATRVKRLIGGEPIEISESPWLVNLRAHVPTKYVLWWAVRYAEVYCGGAIIHRRWILTAAHCFDVAGVPTYGIGQTINWYVKAGDKNLWFNFGQRLCAMWNRIWGTNNLHCWYLPVEKIIIHAQFNAPDNWRNDIALIKLTQDLPLAPVDDTINTVQLPDVASWPLPGANCSIQGWGCTSFGGPLEEMAHSVNVPVLDYSQCLQSGQSIGQGRMCAGYRGGSIGLCNGDSGGPLVCYDDNNVLRLAGIASFTSATSPGDVPGVFTRVSNYLDWINENIAANTP